MGKDKCLIEKKEKLGTYLNCVETKIWLMIMDSPASYVCRISRIEPCHFPVQSVEFMKSLVSVMTDLLCQTINGKYIFICRELYANSGV